MVCKRIVVVLLLCGCATGADGETTLLNVVDEPPSSACEFGGLKIESGLDLDRSGELESSEVETTRYVCNGAEAAPGTVSRVVEQDPGDDCEAGGLAVESGVDANGNGKLDDAEVDVTSFVCHGEDGVDGEDGAPGTNGTNGTNGINGTDGTTYLVDTASEPRGANCSEGGVRVQVGPDNNSDGILNTNEVRSTRYVCNGEDGLDGTDGQDGMNGSGGAAIVASNYQEARVTSSGSTVTVITASLAAPGPGTVIAFATSDAFCTTGGGTDHDCGSPSQGYYRVTNTSSASPVGDGNSYFFLAPDVTENLTRTETFAVSSAGTFTAYVRATAAAGELGFWRNRLVLVYLPN